MSATAERTIVLPELHPAQERILREAKRFNVLACGRRFGKTTLGIDLLTDRALDGVPVAWFAPTYKLLDEPWQQFKRVLQPITIEKREQMHQIKVLGGGSVTCWSLDDANAGRGNAYARVFVDEAGLIANLEEAWNAAIRPTLTDYEGDAYFGGTPKGMNHYWQLFVRELSEPDEWKSWQMPSYMNPFMPRAEIEAARSGMPQLIYEQEYEAKFQASGDGVFRRVSACATGVLADDAYAGTFVMGVDWGMTNDFTVLVCVDAKTGSVVDFDRFNQIDWHLQRNRVRAMAERWRCTAVLVESNSIGGPQASELRREGLPVQEFITTQATKREVIEQLSLAMEHGGILFPPIPELVTELTAYTAERMPSGNLRYGAPEGMHDDCVMALALAHHAAAHDSGAMKERIRGLPRWV